MDSWRDRLKGDPLPWLLEADIAEPAVRYFTLRHILGRPEDDAEVRDKPGSAWCAPLVV